MYQVYFGECKTEGLTSTSLRGKTIKSDEQKYPIKDDYGIKTTSYTKVISQEKYVIKEVSLFANDFYVYYSVTIEVNSVSMVKVVAKADRITIDGITHFEIKDTIDEQSFIYSSGIATSCTDLKYDDWLYFPCLPRQNQYTFYSTEEGGNNATDGINVYPLVSNEELIKLNEKYDSEFHTYPIKQGYGFYVIQQGIMMLSIMQNRSYYYYYPSPEILSYNIRNFTYVTKIYTEGNISKIEIGDLIEENSTVLFNIHLDLFDPNRVYTCAEINEISPEIHDETCVKLFIDFVGSDIFTLSEDDDNVILLSKTVDYYPYAPNNEIQSIMVENRLELKYYPIPPEYGIYHNLYDENNVKYGYEVFTTRYYALHNIKTKTTLVYSYERTDSTYSSKYTYKSFDEDLSYSTDYDIFELFNCPIKNYTFSEMKEQCYDAYEIFRKIEKNANSFYYFTTVMEENPTDALLFGSDDIFYYIKPIEELNSLNGFIDEQPTTTTIINDQSITYAINSDSGIMKKNKYNENNEEIKVYTDNIYVDYKNEKNDNGNTFIVERIIKMKRIDGIFNTSFTLSELNEEESIINGNDKEKMKDCPSGKYKCSELKENCEELYNSECILKENEKSSKLFILEEEEGSDVYSLNEDNSVNNEDKWEKKSIIELKKILSDLIEDSGYISQISFILIIVIILLL